MNWNQSRVVQTCWVQLLRLGRHMSRTMNDELHIRFQQFFPQLELKRAEFHLSNWESRFDLLNLNQIRRLFQSYQEARSVRSRRKKKWIYHDGLSLLGWLQVQVTLVLCRVLRQSYIHLLFKWWQGYDSLRKTPRLQGFECLWLSLVPSPRWYWYRWVLIFHICWTPLWTAGLTMWQDKNGSFRKTLFW